MRLEEGLEKSGPFFIGDRIGEIPKRMSDKIADQHSSLSRAA